VRRNLAAKFALNAKTLDSFTERIFLRCGELGRSCAVRYLKFRKDFLRTGAADAVDGSEPNFQALVVRYCYSSYTHMLSLSLFVARIFTNHSKPPISPDVPALHAHFFNR
jgi:hypothetical protein